MKCGNPFFCLGGDKIVFQRGRIQKLFDVSNLEGELEFIYFYSVSYYCLYVFLSTHAMMCLLSVSGMTSTF